MSNLWNDTNEDELDNPEYHPELDDRGAPPLTEPPGAGVRPQRPARKAVPEVYEEEALNELISDADQVDEEEADHEAALSDARLRLEMGRLYEMVMQSNLFNELDADPQAIKNVQRQIKRFAKEQMEIMLGMRAPKAENTQVVSPFNEIEIDVLKKLAYTATKGASAAGPAPVAKARVTMPEPPKKTTLTPIGAPAPVKKLEAKPQAPLQRKAAPNPKKIVAESEPLDKPVSEMSEDELTERNAQIAERQRQQRAAVPKDRLPPMAPEAMNAMYTSRVQTDKNAAAISSIVALMNKD